MQLATCKRMLSLVWFGMTGLMFLFLLIYTLRGVPFGGRTVEVWNWLMPNVMPTLTLIVSVLVLDTQRKADDAAVPSAFLYRLALALSVVYLTTLLLLIVVPENFTNQSSLELLGSTGIWLGPFQGLVSGALGGFFVKK